MEGKRIRSRIMAAQMDNLRGFLGIRMMYKISNERIREFCGGIKGEDEMIDDGFGHVERNKNGRIHTRMCTVECAGSCSVVRLKKRLM